MLSVIDLSSLSGLVPVLVIALPILVLLMHGLAKLAHERGYDKASDELTHVGEALNLVLGVIHKSESGESLKDAIFDEAKSPEAHDLIIKLIEAHETAPPASPPASKS